MPLPLRARDGLQLSGRALVHASRLGIATVVVVANTAGAAVVFVLVALVIPGIDSSAQAEARLVNAIAAGIYLLLAAVVGLTIGARYARPVDRWLFEDREPTPDEQRRAIRGPLVVFALEALLWACAAVVFGTLNLTFALDVAVGVALVVALGGVTTSAIAYLMSDRMLRPVAIRALATGPPERTLAPGVTTRLLLSWSLGTAVPVFGMVLIGISALVDRDASPKELSLTMIVLGSVSLVVGLLAVALTARAIAGPVRAVRHAVRAVEDGNFDVEVPVDSGSELGRLQAGVNRMVAGLRERERLRDLFGRHVGEDVARAALDRGVELGGETRVVAVLFVDVIGSTRLAVEREPHEVVVLLNRFFDVVVEVVDEHDGWINKFVGDAALAIFGVPAPLEGRDAKALACARELGRRLADEVPELGAGVGVSGGEAVAGNIGATERFEYTVIGDPVNEAARLSEEAKRHDGRVVAAAALLEQAGAEAERWTEHGEVELRGRTATTRIAVPRD